MGFRGFPELGGGTLKRGLLRLYRGSLGFKVSQNEGYLFRNTHNMERTIIFGSLCWGPAVYIEATTSGLGFRVQD